MNQRQEIVAVARRYVGAPWVHQGRSDDGMDCVGLVIKVAHELGYIDWDIKDYDRTAAPGAMLAVLQRHLIQVSREKLRPGDLIALRYPTTNHIGIAADYVHGGISIIHAQATRPQRVVENRLCDDWLRLVKASIAGCFSFPELVNE